MDYTSWKKDTNWYCNQKLGFECLTPDDDHNIEMFAHIAFMNGKSPEEFVKESFYGRLNGMAPKTKIETDELLEEGIKSVTFEVGQDMHSAVFTKLINWYFEMQSFNGESVQQCDRTVISAPEILGDIADMIGFEVEYNDA